MIHTLPAGFGNATVVGSKKGSEFKYVPEDNTVKFIWNSLPDDHEITVSYKVKVNTDAPAGKVTLAGKFFYVFHNQKEIFIIPDVSITVSGAALIIAIATQPETTATTAATVTQPLKVATNNLLDFKDAGNQSQTGFYVVVGSFQNRSYALAAVKRLMKEGFKAANWIYFEPRKFNYVFIVRVNTKEEALKHIANAKAAGYKGVWIQRIIE
jgi:hypothetical protein